MRSWFRVFLLSIWRWLGIVAEEARRDRNKADKYRLDVTEARSRRVVEADISKEIACNCFTKLKELCLSLLTWETCFSRCVDWCPIMMRRRSKRYAVSFSGCFASFIKISLFQFSKIVYRYKIELRSYERNLVSAAYPNFSWSPVILGCPESIFLLQTRLLQRRIYIQTWNLICQTL